VLFEARARRRRAVQDRVQVQGEVSFLFFIFHFFLRNFSFSLFSSRSKNSFLRPETGRWDSPFHYCAGKCRTTSVVTIHENAYISPAHHCWSPSGIPRVPKREGTPPLPSGARVIASGPGETCEAACGVLGLVCSPGGALPLNDCNVLRDHFHCEAGCVDSSTMSSSLSSSTSSSSSLPAPSYVVSTAPQEMRPATCRTIPKGTAQAAAAASASCDLPSPVGAAGGEHIRRLCVCLEPGGMR